MTSVECGGDVYCSFTAEDHQQKTMEKHAFEHSRPLLTTFKISNAFERMQTPGCIY